MNDKPCQTCGATGGDPCITRSGNVASTWHKARTLVTRSPREIEEAFLTAATSAPWLTDIDSPSVSAAAALARQIDDKIHQAETERGLFPQATLAEEGGGLTYDIATFVQLLDRLGLTPAGRHQLNLTEEEADTDDLDRVIKLHG